MVKTNPSLAPGWMKVVTGTLQIEDDGAIGENLFENSSTTHKRLLTVLNGNIYDMESDLQI